MYLYVFSIATDEKWEKILLAQGSINHQTSNVFIFEKKNIVLIFSHSSQFEGL